jgi:hypothetical protein
MEPLDLSWTVTSEQIGSMMTSDRPWNLSMPRRHSVSDSDRSYTSPTPLSDYQDASDGEGASSPKLEVESVVSDPYRHKTKRFLQKYLSESHAVQTEDLVSYGIDPALVSESSSHPEHNFPGNENLMNDSITPIHHQVSISNFSHHQENATAHVHHQERLSIHSRPQENNSFMEQENNPK